MSGAPTGSRPTPPFAVPGYEILALLGRGGMGAVYRARQTALDRDVALKTIAIDDTLSPDAIARFEREAKAVARLAHPHIVAAYDFGRSGGRLHFAMELVTGEDAQHLVARRGRLDEWTVWGLVRQAAAGLAHAAELGFVHRDIKPANLLLTRPPAGTSLPAGLPMLKIADFGLARLADVAADARITVAAMTAGTPCYMAPEQFRGGDVGPAADIHALGATAWHLLAGRPPFAGLSVAEIAARHVEGRPDPLAAACPGVSRASADLVGDMMAADPARRIADYATLLRRIDALELSSPADVATTDLLADSQDRWPSGDELATAAAASASASTVAGPASRPLRPGWPWLVAAGVAIGLTSWAVVGLRPRSVGREPMVAGRSAPLFDGRDLASWRTTAGEWSVAADDEGASVLAGRGVATRSLAMASAAAAPVAPRHFRLACVAALHEADAVGVRFDMPADREDGPRWELRLSRDEVTLHQLGSSGSPGRPVGRAPLVDAGSGRHAIEIERQPRGWWVGVDGATLAAVPPVHGTPAARIELVADGGTAWFSDLFVTELEPAAASAPASGDD